MLEGTVHTQKRHMVSAISFEDIIDYFITVFPAEVDIEVGRTGSVRIQKSFKVKVEINRIYIRNLQAIGYDGVGSASSSYIKKSSALRIAYNIPGNQEVGIKSEFVDNVQFLYYSLAGFPVFASEALHHSVHCQLFQQNPVVFFAGTEGLFVFIGMEVDRYTAAFHNPEGVGNNGRIA